MQSVDPSHAVIILIVRLHEEKKKTKKNCTAEVTVAGLAKA